MILHSELAELRICQVVPIPEEIKASVDDGYDPVIEGETEIEWPMLHGREWKWSKGSFEIEPGEADSLHADFIIDSDVKLVEFYFFLSNSKKKRSDLGWTITQLHEFELGGEETMSQKTKTVSVNNQQERQQKQQQQQKPQKPAKPQPTKKNK